MRLYLMRHGTAVPRGTPGFSEDARRPLTEAGRAEARAVARGLKRLKLPVDRIVTSPYLRAGQTAEEVRRVLGERVAVSEFEALRAEAEPAASSLSLKTVAEHAHVLLIGHEPHLSAWIAELTAGRGGMRCLMKKAGVACIEVERVPPPAGSGTLRWLMTPKQLALIGSTP
jgi:phosphohistidine phosphatase